MCKVSVLMSTHNPDPEYFRMSLESVFAQSLQEFEIVLVDDGSDTPVENLLGKFQDDSRIHLVRLEKNGGLPRALNIGMKLAEGKYIARMDDDDLMEPERLRLQYEFMERNKELNACFSWFDRIDSQGKLVASKSFHVDPKKIKKILLSRGNIFCHSTLFVKTETLLGIDGYDENLRYAQDSDLYVRICREGQIGMVNTMLLQNRINTYRTNPYRDTLSQSFALFASMRHLITYETGLKKWGYMISRVIWYLYGLSLIKK